jgi:hypothetical protein
VTHHEDHSHAGHGAVVLDIGDGVGALVVRMPASLAGTEIEICPAGEDHAARTRSHVAVIGRPAASGTAHTAVFPSLLEGRYELYRKPDGPTQLTVDVVGGEVSTQAWP